MPGSVTRAGLGPVSAHVVAPVLAPAAPTDRVVIVGASIAGLTTAESLRGEGFAGDILLIGAEPHLPYARPPLSKQVLSGAWPADRTVLRSADELEQLDIRLLLGRAVTGVDLGAREVEAGAERVPFDILVIATGVEPRTLAAHPQVRTLRTLDDAAALRADLEGADSIAVIGSGVLGSELASAARLAGLEVALVGRSHAMSLGAVGTLLSEPLLALHRAAGVDVRLDTTVTSIAASGSDGSESRVLLSDGSALEPDLVVAALGATPRTSWLEDSGLDIADGVVCDALGRVAARAPAPAIYAVGDVARWADATGGSSGDALGGAHRAEHQARAIEHGLAVGRTIATGDPTPAAPTLFWSELHGTRVQAYGTFAPGIPLAPLDGSSLPDLTAPGARSVLAAFDPDDGRVTGVVGWNAARAFRDARAAVDASLLTTSRKVAS